MARAEQIKLGLFLLPGGHHAAAWRHPEGPADAAISFAHHLDMARLAERGCFDFVFLADSLNVRTAPPEAFARSAQYIAGLEPLTLLAALAVTTERIGLVATASTSYNEPFHVARKFASLDHLSRGRVGWNIVTSTTESEAHNFNRQRHYLHDERYERAREFVEVVLGLWDSWEDDAFLRDKQAGFYLRPDKVHALTHDGRYFSVSGPLNVPRCPQGRPILVQAGASDDGRQLAAQYADVVFSNHFELEAAQTYYRDLKDRAARTGRDPAHIKIMPGLSAIVGETAREADDKYDYLQSLVDPVLAREALSRLLNGADLSQVAFDEPLPENLTLKEVSGTRSAFDNWVGLARRDNLTVRQLAYRVVGARGKSVIRGTAAQIADHIERWFEGGACDGFNVMPSHMPGGLGDFVTLVVPELQRRKLLRVDYTGTTLRDHLGLARAESRYRAPPL